PVRRERSAVGRGAEDGSAERGIAGGAVQRAWVRARCAPGTPRPIHRDTVPRGPCLSVPRCCASRTYPRWDRGRDRAGLRYSPERARTAPPCRAATTPETPHGWTSP